MDVELIALEQHKTWIVMNLPPNCTTIGCKWVYKLKHKAGGSIERYKARLVAKGFTQLEGMDFHFTFKFVAKLTTVCSILVAAAIKNWKLTHFFMENWIRLSTWISLRVWNNKVQDRYAYYINPCVACDRPIVSGMLNYPIFFLAKVLINPLLIILCSKNTFKIKSPLSLFMLMTLLSLETTMKQSNI